ncbi:hypothetical protein DBL05_15705 [Pseudomonas putida]|nr:hypothetical protein DBL05_15705 [Pseudomonas putida]
MYPPLVIKVALDFITAKPRDACGFGRLADSRIQLEGIAEAKSIPITAEIPMSKTDIQGHNLNLLRLSLPECTNYQ